ncbi:MAG: Hsp20/alpha crystallin family protein [Candidatus Altiarchaeota archaeon]|nr:Hsp20/alpha crystallin family protein [Candidatus Altiarchaeota archaeon]
MFPWRKRGRSPFDDFFNFDFDVGEDFQQFREEMERMMEEARKGTGNKPGEGGPFVYGWSMRVGPDGKPHVEKFGNVPAKGGEGAPEITGEREPLTDVIEGDEEIKVIVELPGVDKKDIKLEAGEETLSIAVDSEKRKYGKELLLPAKVLPDTTKANYNNGVLEVTIKRAERKPDKGTRSVKID